MSVSFGAPQKNQKRINAELLTLQNNGCMVSRLVEDDASADTRTYEIVIPTPWGGLTKATLGFTPEYPFSRPSVTFAEVEWATHAKHVLVEKKRDYSPAMKAYDWIKQLMMPLTPGLWANFVINNEFEARLASLQ
jgi:hypothetical protein